VFEKTRVLCEDGAGFRMKKQGATTDEESTPARAAEGWPAPWTAAALFAAALALRLLFAAATADRSWAYSALFKGDAPLWLDYARALQSGQQFEQGLPIHPPGTAYLLAWLWNGTAAGIPWLRALWAAMGAAIVVALWAAARRSFGPRVAWLAGLWCAAAHALLVLAGSLNAETPHLLLVVSAFILLEDLRPRPRLWALGLWGAANGLACLFRVEHVLATVLIALWLAWIWLRTAPWPRALAWLALLAASFALPLLPWQLHAWRGIARANGEPPARGDAEDRALSQVEARTAGLAWDAGALREREALPAFARRTAADFVAATVRHRGGSQVTASDFGILDEAFGTRPRALGGHPFVSSYGPLNFALANHPSAEGGFSRAALEDPPPLAGGPGRYPSDLIAGLPPPDLTFAYPPHVRLFREGYAIGWGWLRADPVRAGWLAARKLGRFWRGAALGLGGANLPLGASGRRAAVDMTLPDGGALASIWPLALLALCGVGLAAGRRQPALAPWLLLFGSKLLAAVLFFGYARLGATTVPVVAVLLAFAGEGRTGRRLSRIAAVAVLMLLGLELVRYARGPSLRIDGWLVEKADPFPADLHRDQQIELR
jgi:hypothetical protein